MNEAKWQTKIITSINSPVGKVVRTLRLDNVDNPKYKYSEKLEFDGLSGNRSFAICIGLNPAAAEEEIDITNKRLIKLLKDEYNGYHLFNIYPEITDNKKQLNFDDEENREFINKLKDILIRKEFDSLDIIMFFGRTLVIPKPFIDLLEEWNGIRNIFITSHKDEFTHPGSNADIQKKPFEMDFLRRSTCIRVCEK